MSSSTLSDKMAWLQRIRERFGPNVELTSKVQLEGLVDVVMRLDEGTTAPQLERKGAHVLLSAASTSHFAVKGNRA